MSTFQKRLEQIVITRTEVGELKIMQMGEGTTNEVNIFVNKKIGLRFIKTLIAFLAYPSAK